VSEVSEVGVASDSISALLVAQGLRSVGLIDDLYDPLDQLELLQSERDELWARVLNDEAALAELERIGHTVASADELTGAMLGAFDTHRSDCPVFEAAWKGSKVGSDFDAGRELLEELERHLKQELGLDVHHFGLSAPIADLIVKETHLLFLDWYLGDSTPAAVDAAVNKVAEIFGNWPAERQKPLIVLMSSRQRLREQADEFCRRSGILRGMFYAVPKGELTDLFMLRMQMRYSRCRSQPGAGSRHSWTRCLRKSRT